VCSWGCLPAELFVTWISNNLFGLNIHFVNSGKRWTKLYWEWLPRRPYPPNSCREAGKNNTEAEEAIIKGYGPGTEFIKMFSEASTPLLVRRGRNYRHLQQLQSLCKLQINIHMYQSWFTLIASLKAGILDKTALNTTSVIAICQNLTN